MEIELEYSEKALTLNDFEEIESKLGHALPERLKKFYLKYNGGSSKQTIHINKYQVVEIEDFFPFKYNKDFKNAPRYTSEGETLELRETGAISDSILIFAMESTDEGRIAIDLVNGKIYLYPIVGMQGVIFNFGEPRLIADSVDDFFDSLSLSGKQEQTVAIKNHPSEVGIMPTLSNYSVALTKEDIKDFEAKLDVQIPASMKNFYLKFNGGTPSPYCFQPQDEDLDWVEINAFFPIKERSNAFETIEVIAKDIWSRNLMSCNLLPFAMDSGGNYYALNLKNKKIYYYLTDEWDENASREYNFETNTRYIAQSFNYFINHFIEEEE